MSALSQHLAVGTSRNTARMAATMVEKTIETGSCTEDDLINAGFSWSQIVVLGVDAKRQASEQLAKRNFPSAA